MIFFDIHKNKCKIKLGDRYIILGQHNQGENFRNQHFRGSRGRLSNCPLHPTNRSISAIQCAVNCSNMVAGCVGFNFFPNNTCSPCIESETSSILVGPTINSVFYLPRNTYFRWGTKLFNHHDSFRFYLCSTECLFVCMFVCICRPMSFRF